MILHDYFSGTGGFHLGLEKAGFEFDEVCFSEIDKHAIANYKYNFPNAKYIGGIDTVLSSGAGRPNIITFGSPCQDFSLAGLRKGLDGEKSSLIQQAISTIAHYRPDIFIWENVKGAFSSNSGSDFWAIIQAFANIGGYGLEWQLVNTSWLLPQNRERIYLVGHLAESFRNWKAIFPLTENDCQSQIQKQTNRKHYKCRKIAGCLTGGGNSGGLHSDMDIVIHQRGRGKLKDNLNDICPTISSSSFEQNHTVIQVNKSLESGGKQPYQHNRVYDDKGLCPALNTDARSPVVFISEPIHKHGEERIYTEVAPTIAARYGTGGDNVPYINNERRLTEIECERLQGFSDDWTRCGSYLNKKIQKYIHGSNKRWRTEKATMSLFRYAINKTTPEIKEIPKSQRYKMCGNAVTMLYPMIIGKRILANYE